MHFFIGKHLKVTLKHAYLRDGVWHWQRKIPKELIDRYPTSGTLKLNLKTRDPVVAASRIATLDKKQEAIWEAMRKDPSLGPEPAREAARKLLADFGIESNGRTTDSATLRGFFDHLEAKRIDYADRQPEPEEAYRYDCDTKYLSKPEQDALKMLVSGEQFCLSDALEFYLEEHPKRGKASFAKIEEDTRRVWGKLTTLLGEKVFKEVSREDARRFRDHLRSTMSTGGVRRNLNCLVAAFAHAIREKPLAGHPNVFESLKIQGEGLDVKKRQTLTPAHMDLIRAKCKKLDDPMRWALALQMDLGSRIAEVVGLAVADIHLEGAVPYVSIEPHPWRDVKTDGSQRKVPLVGAALWAARRVVETAEKGQQYAFPQYIKDGLCNAESASASLNKWMRAQGIDRTTHCFILSVISLLYTATASPAEPTVGSLVSITSAEFLKLPEKAQAVYVGGIIDGMSFTTYGYKIKDHDVFVYCANTITLGDLAKRTAALIRANSSLHKESPAPAVARTMGAYCKEKGFR